MGEEDKETAANDNEYQAVATADDSGASLQGKGEDAADDASHTISQVKQEQEGPTVSSSAATCSDAMLKVTENDIKVESCDDIGEHDDRPNLKHPADEVKISTIPPKTTTSGGSAAASVAPDSAVTVKGSTTINSTKHIDGQLRSPPKSRHPQQQQQQQMNAYPLTQGYHHPHHHPHHPYHSAVAYNHHHPAYRHPHHPAAYHHHASAASFPHPPPPVPQTHGAPSSSSAPTSSHQNHWPSTAVHHAYSGYYKAYHHQQQQQQLQHPQQQPQNQHQQAKKATEVPKDVSSNKQDTKKKNQHADTFGDIDDPQSDANDPDAPHDRETKCTNKNKIKTSKDDDALVGVDVREARSAHGTDEEGSGKKSSTSITETTKNKERSEDDVNPQEEGGDEVQDICGDVTRKKSTTTRPDTIASSTSASLVMGVGATASWTSQSDNDNNVNISLTTSSSTASMTAASKQRQQHPSQQQYHSHYGWHHAAAAHHVTGGYHQYHLQQQHGYHPYHLQQQPQQQQQHNQNSQQHSQLFPQYHHPYWPGYGGHSQHNVAVTATSSSSHNSGRNAQQQDVGGAKVAKETSITANIETNEQRVEKMKKRHRNESSTVIELQQADDDARDDLNTKESFLSDGYNYEYDCDNTYHDNEQHGSVLCDEDDDDDDTASTGEGDMDSLAGISLGSLVTSPKGKRRKGPPRAFGRSSSMPVAARRSQSIHRTKPTGQYLATVETNEGEDDKSLLKVSSTFSEGGKMILKNLSIHSNYSAELAELCGPSPMAVIGNNANDGMEVDYEGRTPKKRNTKGSKRTQAGGGIGSFEFRLDGLTPAPSSRRVLRTSSDSMSMSHENDMNNDSPTMFDLIGGAETPTTDMLMSNIMETELTDDIRSLNGHLRGQTFTPLHVDAGSGHSLVGGVDESPQLSWSTTNGGSPLEITPRCFGLLDSTKSGRSFSSVGGGKSIHPLGSPRSFWKDTALERKEEEEGPYNGEQGGVKSILSILSPTMREMDVDYDGVKDLEGESRQSTSPLPLDYNHDQEKRSNESTKEIDTPRRVPNNVQSSAEQVSQVHSSPWANDYHHYVRPNSGISHSPIPHHQLHPPHHGAASPYSGHPPPPQGYYHSMYNHTAHHQHQATYNPNERVRNLRGNGPPRHQIPPQHHLPPPSYHHFSPLTNVTSSGRGDRYSGYPLLPHQLDLLTSSSSKRKCVPIKPPIPSKFQGDIEKYKDAQIPEFNNLVNFPGHMSNKPSPNVPDGMRCCVMCGQACPCSTGGKSKKPVYTNSVTSFNGNGGAGSTSGSVAPLGDSTGSNTNKGVVSASSNAMNPFAAATLGNYATIPTQNKGLCTICDVNVWLVTSSGLEIKWCKGCKNFRPWAAFGDKGLATKCVRCRERQREKYALTKEEKDKKKGGVKEDLHFVDPPMSYQ